MTTPYEAGQIAYRSGKDQGDNPYICGTTKLGNAKFSDTEAGTDWLNGWISAKPARTASKQEIAAADRVNVGNFRRKSNRSY